MIRFYLGEEPILEQVPTYVCAREEDRAYVLEHLDKLVVKAVDEAGRRGHAHGPAGDARRAGRVPRARSSPTRAGTSPSTASSSPPARPGTARADAWSRAASISGPTSCPTRGLDGRPWVLPGGLSRVALREGSYVVNSSQGGGSKDTWVLKEASERPPGSRALEIGAVISRVADHCFWFGRYLERAESTARVLAVTGNLALDAELTPEQCWLPGDHRLGRAGALRREARRSTPRRRARSSSGT